MGGGRGEEGGGEREERERPVTQGLIAGPIDAYPSGTLPSEASHQGAHDLRR